MLAEHESLMIPAAALKTRTASVLSPALPLPPVFSPLKRGAAMWQHNCVKKPVNKGWGKNKRGKIKFAPKQSNNFL